MLTPDDVLDPYGPIMPAWFTGESEDAVYERMEIYLAEAYAKPEIEYADDQDAAALRWVEYKSNKVLLGRAAGMAGVTSVTLKDQGSYTLGEGANAAANQWARNAHHALLAWRLLTAEPERARSADGTHAYDMWPGPSEADES